MFYPKPFQRAGRGKTYYFWYTDRDGRRRMISTGCTRKKDAIDSIQDYVNRNARGTDQAFVDYAEPFFLPGRCPREARLRPERKAYGEQHMKTSRRLLERWILTDTVFPALPMNEIRRRDVLDLRKRLIERAGGTNTAGAALDVVKTILSEAEFREDIEMNPGRGVSKPGYDRRERGAFTVDEVRLLLAHAQDLCATDKSKDPYTHPRPRAEVFLHLLFLTGGRVGELRALRWGSVDLEAGTFDIVEAVKGETGTIAKPKWDKVRSGLRMPELLRSALTRWRDELARTTSDGTDCGFTSASDFVLTTANREPIGYTWTQKTWKRIMEHAETHPKVKLDPAGRWLTPHSARHTLNTHLLASRVAPLDVQQYLGWQSEAGKLLTRVQTGYTDLRLLDTRAVAEAIDTIYSASGPAMQQKTLSVV